MNGRSLEGGAVSGMSRSQGWGSGTASIIQTKARRRPASRQPASFLPPSAAIPMLLFGIHQDPEHPAAYRRLAGCYAQMGRFKGIWASSRSRTSPARCGSSESATPAPLRRSRRCQRISVIAANSTFTYECRAVDVEQVGRDLRVDYVLEGSVRRWGRISYGQFQDQLEEFGRSGHSVRFGCCIRRGHCGVPQSSGVPRFLAPRDRMSCMPFGGRPDMSGKC